MSFVEVKSIDDTEILINIRYIVGVEHLNNDITRIDTVVGCYTVKDSYDSIIKKCVGVC